MANEVIGIEVQVKLEQLRTQLATLGPGMEKEAKAMTAALNREIKQQTAAMKRLGTEAATSSGEFSKLSGTVSKTAQVSGALGGVIGKLNPEIGAAVTSVGSFTGAMQGLQGAGVLSMGMLGPLAIAVAALAATYLVLANNLEKAEAKQKAMADAAKAAQTAHEGLDKIVADISDRLAIASGQATKSGVEQRKQIEAVNDAYDKQAKVTYELAASEEVRLSQMKGLEQQRATAIAAIKLTTELEDGAKAKADAAAAASSASSKAAAAAAAAEAAELAEREQALNDWVTASNTAYDQVFEHELAAKESRWALARERVAAAQAEFDADAKRIEETAKLEEEAADQSKAAAVATFDALGSLSSSAADALGAYAQSIAKGNKKAARDAFAVGKVVAMSSALVNTALAVTNALATVPYPAAPIAAAAAAVSGGVQLASIAAQKPSFHRGGMVEEQGRGEVSATLLPGEAVLNRQATSALGAGGVAAINNGTSGGGSVSLRIGRLEAREIIRTDVASGGLVVQAARSAAAKGGNLAGRSGRRPIG